MKKKVNLILDQGLLEYVYSEKITEKELAADRKLFARAISRHGIKKILVNIRYTKKKPSTMGIHAHGAAVAKLPESGGVRIALVDKRIDDFTRFLESVMTNLGVCLECFKTERAARAWLNE